jgi:pimeloyl-ACP methyl ester carboxylesterase
MEDPPYIPGMARDVLADKALAHREFNRKVFAELQQQQLDLAPYLPKIKAPTLLLWGDQDRVIDISSIEVFQRNLTSAKTSVSILPNIGHLPMLEQPGETAKRYSAFLGS